MAPSDPFSAYSDASSTYWPPGWNFARLVHATHEDNALLSDEERVKMQAGLREVLGQRGLEELAEVIFKEEIRIKTEEQKRSGTAPAETSPALQPNWLERSRQYYRDQPWGFVAFYLSPPFPSAAVGTASSDSDASTQQQQREKFQDAIWEIAKTPFDLAVNEGHLEVDESRGNFEIKWVEVVASADDKHATILSHLRSRYQEMREQQKIPLGLAQDLFLVANASSISSVLAGTASTQLGKYWRPKAPFLLAVQAVATLAERSPEEGDDEDVERNDGGHPVFKVAVEVLVEELWPAVNMQTISMGNVTRFVREAQLVEDGDEERQNDDDLDDIFWSVLPPPRYVRKKRGF